MAMQAWVVAVVAVAGAAWAVLVRALRGRRARRVAALDPRAEGIAVNVHTLYVEFPFLSRKALELALFRTYAIPSISAVLARSSQFGAAARKRYDDTDLLVQELLLHHVDGDRGSLALRRLNFLHSCYPSIPNADFLYVLSVFVLLPIEWAALYGYREWTESEKLAYYITWHDIGTRMGIKDIPNSISSLSKFRDEFEAKHMLFADSNREIAEATVKLFLSVVPPTLRSLACRVIYSLMDDRLLKAVRYPKQPMWLCWTSSALLRCHGWVVKLLPPRPLSWVQIRIFPGCPVLQGKNCANVEALHKVAFHIYKPPVYKEGYKIKDLGPMRPGQLGKAHEGDLLCSVQQCSNLAWPLSLCKGSN